MRSKWELACYLLRNRRPMKSKDSFNHNLVLTATIRMKSLRNLASLSYLILSFSMSHIFQLKLLSGLVEWQLQHRESLNSPWPIIVFNHTCIQPDKQNRVGEISMNMYILKIKAMYMLTLYIHRYNLTILSKEKLPSDHYRN